MIMPLLVTLLTLVIASLLASSALIFLAPSPFNA